MLTDRRCHILHVTGNDTDHLLLVELIQKTPDLVLEQAKSANNALERLKSSAQADRPNLIMIDWLLPGPLAGDGLLSMLKSSKTFRSIPVIVIASTIDPPEIDRIYGLGASCVVQHDSELTKLTAAAELIYGFWGSVASLPFCDPAKPAKASKF